MIGAIGPPGSLEDHPQGLRGDPPADTPWTRQTVSGVADLPCLGKGWSPELLHLDAIGCPRSGLPR
jgi:hypothetical protein